MAPPELTSDLACCQRRRWPNKAEMVFDSGPPEAPRTREAGHPSGTRQSSVIPARQKCPALTEAAPSDETASRKELRNRVSQVVIEGPRSDGDGVDALVIRLPAC